MHCLTHCSAGVKLKEEIARIGTASVLHSTGNGIGQRLREPDPLGRLLAFDEPKRQHFGCSDMTNQFFLRLLLGILDHGVQTYGVFTGFFPDIALNPLDHMRGKTANGFGIANARNADTDGKAKRFAMPRTGGTNLDIDRFNTDDAPSRFFVA